VNLAINLVKLTFKIIFSTDICTYFKKLSLNFFAECSTFMLMGVENLNS
jgi:hypothetical protein